MSYKIVETIHPYPEDMLPIDWLWDGYLARGHFHVLAGEPGCGKTQIALSLAVTLGIEDRPFPCGMPNPKALATLMWSDEDTFRSTIIPRLTALKCHVPNFHYISGVWSETEERTDFNPAIHMDALKEKLLSLQEKQIDVGLLIIDSVTSVITGDGNSNNQVRANLKPLAKFAQDHNIAILGIQHFVKNGEGKSLQARVNGSVAMTAVARIVMVAGEDLREDPPTKYVFGKAKANITSADGGFGYNLKHTTVSNSQFCFEAQIISWEKELDVPLKEAFSNSLPHGKIAPSLSKIQQAADLIIESLQKEPMSWPALVSLCEEQKIGNRTAQTARDRLKNSGRIEIEYAQHWGKTAKWKLTNKNNDVSTEIATPTPYVNYANYANSANNVKLLKNLVSDTTVSAEIAEIAEKVEGMHIANYVEEGFIYDSKSDKGFIYNEPFEESEKEH